MDAAEAIVQSLDDAGIEYVFGLPGSVIMNVIDKFHESDVEFVSTRHEQVATSMADGYARVTGRPGVTLVHVGPGAANQVVGLGAAYRDASPIVAIAGNEDLERLGRDIWHEWDVENVLDPITKWTGQVRRGDDAARIVRTGLVKSVSETPGPVFIDLPKDVSREKSTYNDAQKSFYDHNELSVPFSRPEPHSADVECTLHLLEDATKPLVLAGGGCVRSGSGDALKTFVENTGIPVVTSNSGRGILDETSSWSLGVVGRRGSDGANEALGQADLVLGIGARFSGLTTSNWTRPDPETTLVQVDIDSAELASQYPVECPVTADARAFLESITDRAGNIDLSWEEEVISEYRDRVRTERAAFFAYETDAESIGPQRLFATILEEKDDDAIVTQGGGVHASFNARQPAADPHSHLHAISFGGMGYGFPFALGAKLGAPDRQVICVEGDGGFTMVIQDLETAVRYDIDVKIVVYNNFSHGTQKLRQARLFDERYLGTDVENPSFAGVADQFGMYGATVSDPSELRPALGEVLDHDGPALLDVLVDPTVWPSTDDIAQI
ncbi:thiamine pyrophosphate-binding protein [Natrialba sp. INN-245]|uniref:thiamine pyrophosphate-binding protein n=1 Tax=Natrialba sp. INN-245 TaxID=2690967 RepID=UPI0013111A13|nr:thiamine pyrophosphate-binding protein [Natrialba sp. INN-245]MWV38499.1 hypothetical protein [Natrialba sp. INN-245]